MNKIFKYLKSHKQVTKNTSIMRFLYKIGGIHLPPNKNML